MTIVQGWGQCNKRPAAEAHDNLALALDEMGQHRDAAKHLQHAQDKGKDNPDTQKSGILNAQVKMLN